MKNQFFTTGFQIRLRSDKYLTESEAVIVGIEPHAHLILSIAEREFLKSLLTGEALTAKFMYNGIIYNFDTTIEAILSIPSELLFIKYPEIISEFNIRQHKRVSCLVPTLIKLEETSCEGTIVNISMGGCRVLIKGTCSVLDKPPSANEPSSKNQPIQVLLKIPGIKGEAYIDGIVKSITCDAPETYLGIAFEKLDEGIHSTLDIYISSIERIEHSYYFQTSIASILQISMEPVSFTEQLNRILRLILSIPGLSLQSKGSIHVTDENEPDTLLMKAHYRLNEDLINKCHKIPFGKCLCGRTASTREIVFADCIDYRHDNRFMSMLPHGHYCVPIISNDKSIGVINMYIKEGQKRDKDVEDFLVSVANILASLIERRMAEKRKEELAAELSRKNRELKEYNKELKALNQLKNKFLGIASHDLRSPLTSVIGYSDLLLLEMIGSTTEDQKEAIGFINAYAHEMLSLVNDFLDVCVIESGKMKIQISREFLKRVIEDRMKIQKMIAKQKKEITIHTELEEVGECSFDKNRVGQVLDNLISNAVKFSSEGSNIYVTLNKEDSMAKVSVSDEGPGISQEDQGKLFGEFQRLDAQPTAGEKSTGLGLSIVKKIVESHNGIVGVNSEQGKGSEFFFKLPL